MTKPREDKRAEPSLWGLMIAINSEHMPLSLPPLRADPLPLLHHEINRAAGVDVPRADVVTADGDQKEEEAKP